MTAWNDYSRNSSIYSNCLRKIDNELVVLHGYLQFFQYIFFSSLSFYTIVRLPRLFSLSTQRGWPACGNGWFLVGGGSLPNSDGPCVIACGDLYVVVCCSFAVGCNQYFYSHFSGSRAVAAQRREGRRKVRQHCYCKVK